MKKDVTFNIDSDVMEKFVWHYLSKRRKIKPLKPICAHILPKSFEKISRNITQDTQANSSGDFFGKG